MKKKKKKVLNQRKELKLYHLTILKEAKRIKVEKEKELRVEAPRVLVRAEKAHVEVHRVEAPKVHVEACVRIESKYKSFYLEYICLL